MNVTFLTVKCNINSLQQRGTAYTSTNRTLTHVISEEKSFLHLLSILGANEGAPVRDNHPPPTL